jgi:hypothetical protein
MAFEADRIILLVASAAMLLLAAVILAAGPARGINRAFAALVAVRGMATMLPQVSTDPTWLWAALEMQPYFVLAIVPLALYCLLAFGATPQRLRIAGWTTLAAILLLDVAYAVDHSLFHGLARGEAETGALRAAAGIQYTSAGPLAAIASASSLALALLGLRLALRYREEARGPQGTTLLLLASGLLLGSLFDGASRLAALTSLLDEGSPYPWFPWGWAVVLLPVTALVPAFLAAIVLAAGRNIDPRPQRVLEGRVLVLACFAFFSGFLRLVLPADSDPAGQALVLVLLGVWRLTMPVLVAYALVLQRWKGAASRTREAVAWLGLAACLATAGMAAAFLASGIAQSPLYQLAGLAAAAALATAARPLLALSRRFAAWLLPEVPPPARTARATTAPSSVRATR